jgi:prepilin-type N-terminal cleavage/methylation domain-containing protein
MKRGLLIRRKQGVTLIELVVSLALLGLVLSLGSSMLISFFHVPAKAANEYDIQSNLRLLTQQVNTTIRDASATFALYRTNSNNLTSGWNYIIAARDHTALLNTAGMRQPTIMTRLPSWSRRMVTFDLVIVKNNPPDADRLLQYRILAHINSETREISPKSKP